MNPFPKRMKYRRVGLWIVSATLAAFAVSVCYREMAWLGRYLLVQEHAPENPQTLPDCRGCNLILVSLDTLRLDRLGFMNPQVNFTPHLDEIASRAAVFSSAFTNAYYTTPAHMTVFTSLFPQRHRIESLHPESLSTEYSTLAEVFKKSGYRTLWLAPLNSRYLDRNQGFGRGFEVFHESPFRRGGGMNPTGSEGFNVFQLNEAISDRNRPFMMFLHSWVTHSPLIWPDVDRPPSSLFPYARDLIPLLIESLSGDPELILSEIAMKENIEGLRKSVAACIGQANPEVCLIDRFGADPFWHALGRLQSISVRRRLRGLTESALLREAQFYRQAYDTAVADLDRQIGQFWEQLQRLGILENTVVIFFSDHGEELLERGLRGHSTFFDHVVRIPLVIHHPRLESGLRSEALVSLVDIMPMALKMLGIPVPLQAQGRIPWEENHPYVYGSSLGADYIRGKSWKLIRNFKGEEKLYFLPLDPEEKSDLSGYLNPWVRAAYRRLAMEREAWILWQTLPD